MQFSGPVALDRRLRRNDDRDDGSLVRVTGAAPGRSGSAPTGGRDSPLVIPRRRRRGHRPVSVPDQVTVSRAVPCRRHRPSAARTGGLRIRRGTATTPRVVLVQHGEGVVDAALGECGAFCPALTRCESRAPAAVKVITVVSAIIRTSMIPSAMTSAIPDSSPKRARAPRRRAEILLSRMGAGSSVARAVGTPERGSSRHSARLESREQAERRPREAVNVARALDLAGEHARDGSPDEGQARDLEGEARVAVEHALRFPAGGGATFDGGREPLLVVVGARPRGSPRSRAARTRAPRRCRRR